MYQYHIEGRRIKNTDEALLHSTLGLMELISRRKKHLLQIIYIKRSRSHQTQRANLSGLLFLFGKMIKARIHMFRCGKAPSSGFI